MDFCRNSLLGLQKKTLNALIVILVVLCVYLHQFSSPKDVLPLTDLARMHCHVGNYTTATNTSIISQDANKTNTIQSDTGADRVDPIRTSTIDKQPTKTIQVAQALPPASENLKITKTTNGYKDVVCDYCFRRDYHYINKPVSACSNKTDPSGAAPQLFMVVAVMSAPGERLQRDVVRETWVSMTRNNTRGNVRHVFLLGATNDKHQQELIDKESLKYDDIVQQSFLDTYNNLTLKMLMMMQWSTEYCSNARYIFKVDSDLFVNLYNVIDVIKKVHVDDKLMGQCGKNSGPIRGASKWQMTVADYPQNKYAPFCLGPRYVVPMRVARSVLAVAPNTPPIRLEDVYLGMLLNKTPYDVQTIDITRYGSSASSNNCAMVTKVVTKHNVRSVSLSAKWTQCFKSWYATS